MLPTVSRRVRMLATGLIAGASLLALSAPAQAGLLVRTTTSCDSQPLERPFARWLDPLQYTLAPDGGLEAGARDWTLSKASVVSGNESHYVRSASDSKSLYLPEGSSATTRSMCVGVGHLVARFFAKSKGTTLLSLSRLQGAALPSTSWSPTLPLPVVANLLPLLPGARTPVAFRFTPKGKGSWWIDDVYVDPHRRS
jgi:hypothetical protein